MRRFCHMHRHCYSTATGANLTPMRSGCRQTTLKPCRLPSQRSTPISARPPAWEPRPTARRSFGSKCDARRRRYGGIGRYHLSPGSGSSKTTRRGLSPEFGIRHQSEEKVPLVGFAICSAVSPEAHFLGIVSAEFVTKGLTVWSAPRLQLAVHDRQLLAAKRAASRCVGILSGCVHQNCLRVADDFLQ